MSIKNQYRHTKFKLSSEKMNRDYKQLVKIAGNDEKSQ